MKLRPDNPKVLLAIIGKCIAQCQGFKRADIQDTGFDAWHYNGMHDPPKSGRRYARVLQLSNFETGFAQNGFLVQVDLLDVPDEGLQAAVFVRSKDYPKGKNRANATFKFRWDEDAAAYVVDFAAQGIRQALQNPSKLPPYIRPVTSRVGRAAIGERIDVSLAHSLLLVADFAAQVAAGVARVRDPRTF